MQIQVFRHIHAALPSLLGLALLLLPGCGAHTADPGSSSATDDLALAAEPMMDPASAEPEDAPRYFPLHEGDFWVYVVTGSGGGTKGRGTPETAEVAVTGHSRIGESAVYQVDNYLFPVSDRRAHFFNRQPGEMMEVANGVSRLWYPYWQFSSPGKTGVKLPGFYDDCIGGSRGFCFGPGTVTVPAGTFEEAATIYYDTIPCGDRGLVSEVLAPDVGLIQRTVTSFAGETTWSPSCAVVGGQVWGTPPSSRPSTGP